MAGIEILVLGTCDPRDTYHKISEYHWSFLRNLWNKGTPTGTPSREPQGSSRNVMAQHLCLSVSLSLSLPLSLYIYMFIPTWGYCITILYYTILYYTILYYTILYYTILYYTILYYTILYYTILYYTILYYTIRGFLALAGVPLWKGFLRAPGAIDSGKSSSRFS